MRTCPLPLRPSLMRLSSGSSASMTSAVICSAPIAANATPYPECMREILGPPLRAAAFAAFLAGCLLLFLNPPSFAHLGGLATILVGAIAIVLITAWVTTMAIGREMPEPEFRKLVDRSEALAALPAPDYPPSDFDLMVIEAIDNLPPDFQALLADTPVVISNLGHEHRAYGMYMGGT